MVLSDGFCISHSLESREEKLRAVSKGGLASRGALMPLHDPAAPDPTLDSPKKLVKRIERIAGDHLRGRLNDTQTLAQLATCRASWEVLSGDRRLKVLERPTDPAPRWAVKIQLEPAARGEISNGRGGYPHGLAIAAVAEGGPDGSEPPPEPPKSGNDA
jgi:hypothetical protein